MGHDHGAVAVDPRTARVLSAVAGALAVLTVIGMVLLRPGDGSGRPDLGALGASTSFYDGEVVSIDSGPCEGTTEGQGVTCDLVEVEVGGGPDRGETVVLEFPESPTTPTFDRGDGIVLSYASEAEPGFEYQFADRQRRPVLAVLAVLFAAAVIVLGRVRGVAALAGLAAGLAVLLGFALPAIIDGRSPVAVAVVASAAVAFPALYLAHGLKPMTTVALLGTLSSLALTAALATLFVELASFSGFSSEEAVYLQAAGGSIDLRGLMLAGVVIGALGALDDMTVTQTSAIWELRSADPTMSTGRLLRAGMRIGRDHVASTTNTLFLAYAGASMPLLVLFVVSRQSLASVVNSEVVAVEVVRTLVGSIGLVASVPLTSWLAARTATAVAEPPAP